MTVYEDFDGYFCVANADGEQEMGGFSKEQDAWDWIAMQDDQ